MGAVTPWKDPEGSKTTVLLVTLYDRQGHRLRSAGGKAASGRAGQERLGSEPARPLLEVTPALHAWAKPGKGPGAWLSRASGGPITLNVGFQRLG